MIQFPNPGRGAKNLAASVNWRSRVMKKTNPGGVTEAIERQDTGRGFGVVMPHFYRNWKDENLRRFILNGIVWRARRDVPTEGVRTTLPALATF